MHVMVRPGLLCAHGSLARAYAIEKSDGSWILLRVEHDLGFEIVSLDS